MTKNKKSKANQEEKIDNYYDLKVDAINSLSEAFDEDKIKEVEKSSEIKEEVKKNNSSHSDFLSKIPTPIKALFVKFWFNGLCCYLFMVGLGYYIADNELVVLITGIGVGVFNDLFVNSIFLYFGTDKEYHPYMLLPYSAKKVWTLAVNIPASVLEVFFVAYIVSLINIAIVNAKGLEAGSTPFSVGPLSFGLMLLIIEMIPILIKDLIVYLVNRQKNKSKGEKDEKI